MTALFISVCGRYFDQFKAGTKRDELRRYGPRWNERTCVIGRAVVLSRGYRKGWRLSGIVSGFARLHGSTFEPTDQAAILERFGTLDLWIARISITGLVAANTVPADGGLIDARIVNGEVTA